MNCAKCGKDITNNAYKVVHRGKVYCIICYRYIPFKERVMAVREREPK